MARTYTEEEYRQQAVQFQQQLQQQAVQFQQQLQQQAVQFQQQLQQLQQLQQRISFLEARQRRYVTCRDECFNLKHLYLV